MSTSSTEVEFEAQGTLRSHKGSITTMPVSRLRLFAGTKEEGLRLSMEDADQFNIVEITAWRGDPETRTTMEFEVLFEGEKDPIWLTWTRDLSDSSPFDTFCKRHHPLYPLVFDLQKSYMDAKAALNRTPITVVSPGDQVYLSLRFFSTRVYDEEMDADTLPDKYHVDYVVIMRYTRWSSRAHTRIDGVIPVFAKMATEFSHLFVQRWGRTFELSPAAVLVDETYIRQHKDILKLALVPQIRAKMEKLYA
jgi:hypothetical protein